MGTTAPSGRPAKVPTVGATEMLLMIVNKSSDVGTKPPTAVTFRTALGSIVSTPLTSILSKLDAEETSEENPPVGPITVAFIRLRTGYAEGLMTSLTLI